MFGSNKLHPFNGYHEPASAFIGTNAGLISAGVSVLGAVQQYDAQKDQAKAQEKAQRIQQNMSNIEEHRKRVQTARETRIKRAMIESQTTSQGMGLGTSGYAGGTGAVQSQYAGNIGYSTNMQNMAGAVSSANQQAIDAGNRAQTWQTIGGIAQQATPWNEIFGGGVKRQVGTSPWKA